MFKGIVKLSKNGKGSLLVSEDLSFKLSRKELFKVFPGDKVECSLQQDKATIQKIIARNTTEVIGKLKKTNKGISEDFILKKIDERLAAKQEGNYKLADQIRDELLKKDVVIEDQKDKTVWKFK